LMDLGIDGSGISRRALSGNWFYPNLTLTMIDSFHFPFKFG
jgi:hypothetical protein